MRFSSLALWLAALPLAAQVRTDPGPMAIQGARIVPVKGAVIESGTILIDKGFIQAVGAEVKLPQGTWVIEGKGLTVYPGLVDGLCDLGFASAPVAPGGGRSAAPPSPAVAPAVVIKGPEDRPDSTPWIQAADEFKADDKRFEQWRNGGFTAVFTGPKNGLLPGQGAVLLTAAARPQEMVLKASAGLLVSFQPQPGHFPASLMGVHAYLRQTFEDARHLTLERKAAEGRPASTPVPAHDRSLLALNQALGLGEPALLPGTTPVQMERAIGFAKDMSLRPILVGGQQAYANASYLKSSKVPVLLNAKWPARDKDGDPERDEGLRTLRFREQAPSSAAALEKAGVLFALTSGDQTPAEFMKAVRKAVEAGLSKEAAIRALTLSPAEILGVADRVGSLEPGKLANLLIANGDLLEEKTKISLVFVSGVKFEVPEKQDEPEKGPRGRGQGRRPEPGSAESNEEVR
jgi:hypothetical protein